MNWLVKLVIAVVIAALVALVLIDLVGPWLVETDAPFVKTLGDALKGPIAYLLGILAGALFYWKGTI